MEDLGDRVEEHAPEREEIEKFVTDAGRRIGETVKDHAPDREDLDRVVETLEATLETTVEKVKSLPPAVSKNGKSTSPSESVSRHETADGDWEGEHLRFGEPVIECSDCTRIIRRGYALLHDNTHQIPLWTAYRLDPEDKNGSGTRDKSRFKPDPLLKDGDGEYGELDDYRKSGYDRGHMAPAASQKTNQDVMDECFYLSNMCPQLPGFNRGEWRLLEEQVRDWLDDRDQLWVVMGPGLEDGAPRETIGDGVAAPTHFWKIIVDERHNGELVAIAFWFPHVEDPGPFMDHVVSIDTIEANTGLDLFPDLPDAEEIRLEARVRVSDWVD